MNEDNSVAVIIPVYNAEKSIKECIDGLLSQVVMPNQIILINDGSTDNSLKVMKTFFSSSPLIEIYSQKNRGVSSARNLGLRHVHSKYVTFVDADDCVKKDHINNLLKGYGYPDVDLSISGICYKGITNNTKYSEYNGGWYNSSEILHSLFYESGQKGYLWNKLWKMNIISSHNLALQDNISMAEDLLFLVKYLQYSNKVYVSNKPTYIYKMMENSLSSQIRLDNFDSRFIKTNNDFLYVCKEILNYIPLEDEKTMIDAQAFLGRTAANYLRQLQLYSKDDNLKLKKQVREICSQSKKDVIRTQTMTIKNKIGFFLTLYFPVLMRLLDKKRFEK